MRSSRTPCPDQGGRSLFRLFLLVLLTFPLLSACSQVAPSVYDNETPKLVLKDFLEGRLQGRGIYQDRTGKVTHRFRIDMTANWEGNVCTFIEDFVYSDGRKEQRRWTLTEVSPGRFTALANDSAGPGSGEAHGNTLHWIYPLRLTTEYGEQDVTFDYWMYRLDETTMMNRFTVEKFGITLGNGSVLFEKLPG